MFCPRFELVRCHARHFCNRHNNESLKITQYPTSATHKHDPGFSSTKRTTKILLVLLRVQSNKYEKIAKRLPIGFCNEK